MDGDKATNGERQDDLRPAVRGVLKPEWGCTGSSAGASYMKEKADRDR